MAYRVLEGPVIAGLPKGYPTYWKSVESTPYASVRRKKPATAEQLLSNPTPWSHSKIFVRKDPVWEDGVVKSPLMHSIGDPSVNSLLTTTVVAQIREESLKRLATKIKGTQWDLSVMIGELPKTQKWMIGAVKEVATAYRALRKGNMRQLKRLAKRGRAFVKKRGLAGTIHHGAGQVSSRWMEFRYAVMPVVYDAQSALNVLYDSQVKPSVRRVSAGKKLGHLINIVEVYPSYNIRRVSMAEGQGRAVVYFRVHPVSEQLKRFGLINLPALLWELTPLSFVVDWFLPVGDYLSNLDTMAGVDVLGGTYSLRVKGESHMIGASYRVKKGPNEYYNVTIGNQESRLDSYIRTVENSKSLAPTFKFGSTPAGDQLKDAVALSRLLLFKP